MSIELTKRVFEVTGVEVSPDFLKIAKNNAEEANVSADFKEGNVSNLLGKDNFSVLLFAVLHLRISRSLLRYCMKCIGY